MKKIAICILITLLIIMVCLFYDYNKSEQFERFEKFEKEEFEETKEYEKFKEQGTISNVNYKILNNFGNYNYNYSMKGYYIDTLNEPKDAVYYIIAMGEQRTGGYSIFITDLKIDEKGNVEVIVHETSPNFGEITTTALTYPICCLELDSIPKNITIKNTKGYVFRQK